jgi:hypothetical protein
MVLKDYQWTNALAYFSPAPVKKEKKDKNVFITLAQKNSKSTTKTFFQSCP